MKKSTSIHENIEWGERELRCIHEMTRSVVRELLALIEDGKGKLAQERVSKLVSVSGGWPGYCVTDRRATTYEVLKNIEAGHVKLENVREFIELLGSVTCESLRLSDQTPRWKGTDFFCPHYIEFNDVERILDDWSKDQATSREVLDFVEHLGQSGGGFPNYPQADPRSVIYAILENLESLYAQPILREDIPAFKEVLRKGRRNPREAWNDLHQYFKQVDWEERLKSGRR